MGGRWIVCEEFKGWMLSKFSLYITQVIVVPQGEKKKEVGAHGLHIKSWLLRQTKGYLPVILMSEDLEDRRS